jgi:ABC-2 type transport system ATP-binding protein
MKIEVKNIQKNYGKQQVLKEVSFSAVSGECIGILGDNGCGKSTLLSILAGVQKAKDGAFLADGNNLFQNRKMQTRLVGYVPQGVPLMEELTAWDNLLLWYDKKSLQKELEQGVLKMLGIGDFLKKKVSEMSGGMKKRLSIGCSVAGHPGILLLDEPMAALDLSCKKNIFDYIIGFKKAGGIVLLVTHDVLEFSLCDRCFEMKDGRLVDFDHTNGLAEWIRT